MEYFQSPFSKGEQDLKPDITNRKKPGDGMCMYPFSKKKPMGEFYYISPKFDNGETPNMAKWKNNIVKK